MINYMEASEPKLVNPVLKTIVVNSLRLGGFHIVKEIYKESYQFEIFYLYE